MLLPCRSAVAATLLLDSLQMSQRRNAKCKYIKTQDCHVHIGTYSVMLVSQLVSYPQVGKRLCTVSYWQSNWVTAISLRDNPFIQLYLIWLLRFPSTCICSSYWSAVCFFFVFFFFVFWISESVIITANKSLLNYNLQWFSILSFVIL